MNGPRLTKMGPVIAVLDRDKLDKLLNLPKGSCRTEQLRHLAKWSESVSYLLLEDNMESLIAVCAQVLGDPTSLEKPSPVERDRLVNKVAWSRELSLQVAQEYSPLARILQVLERQWPRQT